MTAPSAALAPNTPPLGVVLFAHGSRDPKWRLPIEQVAQAIHDLSGPQHIVVRCAYLELCEPDLPQAVVDLVQHGVQQVRVFPVFFGMGKHAREDLPQLVADLRQQHPGLTLEVLPAAGEHPALIHLLATLAMGQSPSPTPVVSTPV